jgi:hypothetical protein
MIILRRALAIPLYVIALFFYFLTVFFTSAAVATEGEPLTLACRLARAEAAIRQDAAIRQEAPRH